MAIAYVAAGTQAESNGDSNTLAVPVPAGVAAGYTLVTCISNQRNEDWDVSQANGFTLVRNQGGAAAFWKTCDGSEAGSINFTKGGTTGELTGGMLLFSGVNPANPINVSNSANSLTVTTMSTTVADTMFIWYAACVSQFSTFSTYAMATNNPTWTERFDWGRAGQIASATATGPRSATGATGNCTASASAGAETYRGIVFALEPAPPTSIKTFDELAYASVKTVNGLAIASIKNINALA